ncbi:MAG: hypothetical protein HY053_00955 [Proteobacteria bacterium]|nr:hypothetical protein [Pseudomonadota bacterium]
MTFSSYSSYVWDAISSVSSILVPASYKPPEGCQAIMRNVRSRDGKNEPVRLYDFSTRGKALQAAKGNEKDPSVIAAGQASKPRDVVEVNNPDKSVRVKAQFDPDKARTQAVWNKIVAYRQQLGDDCGIKITDTKPYDNKGKVFEFKK